MKAKVLVVGGGGREHAIIQALKRSPKVGVIYCTRGSAGLQAEAQCIDLKDLQIHDLLSFAIANKIDLTVVGPEIPISEGIADAFCAAGLRIFAPSAAAARIESSKDFAKRLMLKYHIPTADFVAFDDYHAALAHVRCGRFPTVLKYDGLAAGKGVVIAANLSEAQAALKAMLLDEKFGKGKVIVEEFLTGPEFSFMCFVSGENVWPMEVAQDHKRAFENDEGPNTGGMGAYSPVPFITEEDKAFSLDHIMRPVASALVKEACPFKGVLYGGLIKTPDGIKVIEFNCRFGDPETEVVLPRLLTDVYDVFCAVADGTEFPELRWKEEAVLGIVMAAKGYPGEYDKGMVISGLDEVLREDVAVFHMGTAFRDGETVSAGGRVLMVTAAAESLQQAGVKALDAVSKIHCPGLFYRKDIGGKII